MDAFTAERWDRAAGDYQRTFRLGQNEYNRDVFDYWEREGMLFPGCRVLDIGCGIGKYGVLFAELGCDVTLIDISPKMLCHAEHNMAGFTTPWRVFCCDFSAVSGEEPVFAGGFDFAVSTMSPAIHDVDTVRKMSRMTDGWCFLSRFSEWHQPFRDLLMREMGMQPRTLFQDLKSDCDEMIRTVRDAGFVPQVRCVDYNWEDRRTPEGMADYLCRYYCAGNGNPRSFYEKARQLARRHADTDGQVADGVKTRVTWISWDTSKKCSRRQTDLYCPHPVSVIH